MNTQSDVVGARIAPTVRTAGAVYVATATGFAAGAVWSLWYLGQHGELPMTPFGFRAFSGPFEALGTTRFTALGWLFVGVCAVEALAGFWLWRGRRRGGRAGHDAAGRRAWGGFRAAVLSDQHPHRALAPRPRAPEPPLSRATAADVPYLRPPWLQRHLEPPLMARLPGQPSLRVRGRTSGRIRTIPVRPVEVGASRYLVALLGDTNWARNLRASGTAELVESGTTRRVRAVEVSGDERAAAVAEYLATSRYGPTIRLLTRRLPDPDDHPVFRIEPV